MFFFVFVEYLTEKGKKTIFVDSLVVTITALLLKSKLEHRKGVVIAHNKSHNDKFA